MTLSQTKRIPPRLQWFNDARFGMFIHWGAYAVPARNEWVMILERIPPVEYARYADQFKAECYNPAEWVALAQQAGMRYMVLTTRHHDGFSLFDSKHSDFTAPKTAAGRDLVAEYVDACRKAGMRVGLYYSLGDWRYPAIFRGPEKDPAGWSEMVDYAHAQVRELMSNYGKIDILWYDGAFVPGCDLNRDPQGVARAYRAEELNRMVRELQPEIIINERSGTFEDIVTPEQRGPSAEELQQVWEKCLTMNTQWGYTADGTDYKTVKRLIIEITACAAGAGNFLLNVGPHADGTFPEESSSRLREVGEWMRVHGEAIYGSEPCDLFPGTLGVFSRKGDKIYLHVHWWPGSELCLPSMTNEVKSATILRTGQRATIDRLGHRVFLRDLPAQSPDPYCTVIELELDGEPVPGPDMWEGWDA
ncbi:MAG TPA: alpha-L-fucosidase, partial [Armatimonadota bacterium]